MTLGVADWLLSFFSGVRGGSKLWKIFVGVYISPPLVFVSRPGGTKILGMLAFSKLVMCALFTPRIILEEGELLFKHSSPCEKYFPGV